MPARSSAPPAAPVVRTLVVAGLAAAAASGAAVAQTTFVEVASELGIQHAFDPSSEFTFGIAMMAAGGAAGDFDRDGDQDLFVLGGGDAPDRLYMNEIPEGGGFVDRAVEWGVDVMHKGMGVAVGDVDGDGWLDVYVTSLGEAGVPVSNGHHRLYRNLEGTGFEEVAAAWGVDTTDSVPNGFSPAFGDYDLDGDLDLFVAGWFTNGGNGNRLFRNDGGTFTDATVEAGLEEEDVHGFTPRFVDMDGDRFPELLLVADFLTSRYYRNDGDGTFTDLTAASGTGIDCNGMGSAVGDFDGDGRPDWYVTAIYNVTNPRDPCGNMLYMNEGDHAFVERSTAAGTVHGWWGWGAVAVDVDLDGRQDLLATNGWADGSFEQIWSGRTTRLFRHLGTEAGVPSFADEAEASGLDHDGQGRGMIRIDVDLDGDQDVVTFSAEVPQEPALATTLHRNDAPAGRHGLRVLLDTSANDRLAPDGFGSRVVATSATLGTQYRWLDGGSHYLSQSELSAPFGLGPDAVVDELRVEWSSGQVSVLMGVAAGGTITVVAPSAEDVNADGIVGFADLLGLITEWGPCPACAADVDGDRTVGFPDLVRVLTAWD